MKAWNYWRYGGCELCCVRFEILHEFRIEDGRIRLWWVVGLEYICVGLRYDSKRVGLDTRSLAYLSWPSHFGRGDEFWRIYRIQIWDQCKVILAAHVAYAYFVVPRPSQPQRFLDLTAKSFPSLADYFAATTSWPKRTSSGSGQVGSKTMTMSFFTMN